MDDRVLKSTTKTTDEVNAKTPAWVVKINVRYYNAYFEFDTPEEACRFMSMAVVNNVKGEDSVNILMYSKREDEEEGE